MTGNLTTRHYVLSKCAISIDGYLDDASDRRLVLSSNPSYMQCENRIRIVSTGEFPPAAPDDGDLRRSISPIPHDFSLGQNFPNPFNPVTTIQFDIQKASFVTLKVYKVLGQEVMTLVNEDKKIGRYEIKYDASTFSSDVYYYRLVAGEFVSVKKLILMK